MAESRFPQALLRAASADELAIVVGSGVTIDVTGDSTGPASWPGLIRHGLDYARSQGLMAADAYEATRAMLDSEFEGALSVASTTVRIALQDKRADWFREAFEPIRREDRDGRLLGAIAALPAALTMTTNFDSLLCEELGRTPITWRDPKFGAALADPQRYPNIVLHLHGHWGEDESVVLDPVDYAQLNLRLGAIQSFRAACASKTLLFIACGPAGLADPHFKEVWRWLGQVQTRRQHYAILPEALCTPELRAVSGDKLSLISYTSQDSDPHAELPELLEEMVSELEVTSEQISGVGRIAVSASETPGQTLRVSVIGAQGFHAQNGGVEAIIPPGAGPGEDVPAELSANLGERLHRLLMHESHGADLVVLVPPASRADLDQLIGSADSPLLLAGPGALHLGGPDRELTRHASPTGEDATIAFDSRGEPLIAESKEGGGEGLCLDILGFDGRPANTHLGLRLSEQGVSVVAAASSWQAEDTSPSSVAASGLHELVLPKGTDFAARLEIFVPEGGAPLLRGVGVREVLYGLDRDIFAGLSRVVEGDAPLRPETLASLRQFLRPFDQGVYPTLRRDLESFERAESEEPQLLSHIAAREALRSAPEALYESSTEESEEVLALLPWVRRSLRKASDMGAALAAQEDGAQGLLVAASLGDFSTDRAKDTFVRQRSLLSIVADKGLTLAYTIRSRRDTSRSAPDADRRFLIHCFGSDHEDGPATHGLRKSVASILQGSFHDAYSISYSTGAPEDLDDVRVAAGEPEGYAVVRVIPTAPSTEWPASDYGLIADYIRAMSADVAITWRAYGKGAVPASDAETGAPAAGLRQPVDPEHPSIDLVRLAFDPAYQRSSLDLACYVAVRDSQADDLELAREIASVLGSEVFGAGGFRIAAAGERPEPVSAGHALLAMHPPFGRMYVTSFDARRRHVHALDDQRFSAGVGLGSATRRGVERDWPEPVTLNTEERFHHVHVVGRPGVGKTTLLKKMILDDLGAGHGVTVVDPHGSLADWVIENMPAERAEDALLVDLDERAFAPVLNPLDTGSGPGDYEQVVSEIIHFIISRNFHTFAGPVFEQLVRLALSSMRDPAYPVAPALTELVLLLANAEIRSAVSTRVQDAELRDGWSLQSRQDPKNYAEALQWVTAKFDELTKDPTLRSMFGGEHNTLDIPAAVREGRPLIFRLAATHTSQKAADFIGSMLLTALQDAVLDLDTAATRPAHFVYIDEFHRFATLGLERLVVEGRKFRVGMTLAHQNLSQLSGFHQHTGQMLEGVPSTLVGNAGTLVVFPVSSYDRDRLAHELGCSSEEIGALARFQALCRMAVGGGSIEPFTLEIDDMGEVAASPRMVALRTAMREKGVWQPGGDLLASVAARHQKLRSWAGAPPQDRPSHTKSAEVRSPKSSTNSFFEEWIARRNAELAEKRKATAPPADGSGGSPLTEQAGEVPAPSAPSEEDQSAASRASRLRDLFGRSS